MTTEVTRQRTQVVTPQLGVLEQLLHENSNLTGVSDSQRTRSLPAFASPEAPQQHVLPQLCTNRAIELDGGRAVNRSAKRLRTRSVQGAKEWHDERFHYDLRHALQRAPPESSTVLVASPEAQRDLVSRLTSVARYADKVQTLTNEPVSPSLAGTMNVSIMMCVTICVMRFWPDRHEHGGNVELSERA